MQSWSFEVSSQEDSANKIWLIEKPFWFFLLDWIAYLLTCICDLTGNAVWFHCEICAPFLLWCESSTCIKRHSFDANYAKLQAEFSHTHPWLFEDEKYEN